MASQVFSLQRSDVLVLDENLKKPVQCTHTHTHTETA